MKVFGCKRNGGYSGGLIMVAANSIKEAIKIAKRETYDASEYNDYDWVEYPLLSYSGKEPCVIDEGGYTE